MNKTSPGYIFGFSRNSQHFCFYFLNSYKKQWCHNIESQFDREVNQLDRELNQFDKEVNQFDRDVNQFDREVNQFDRGKLVWPRQTSITER